MRVFGVNRGSFQVVSRSPLAGLGRFLTSDTNGEIFRQNYNLGVKGHLVLGVPLGDGRFLRPICGLKDQPALQVEIREESWESGRGKILRGWALDADPTVALPRITYLLAEKKNGTWHLLDDPRPLSGVSEVQQVRYDQRRTTELIHHGLRGGEFSRWWTVYAGSDNQFYVSYQAEFSGHQVRRLNIAGFTGKGRVFSRIREEEGEIRAYFYPGEAEALAGEKPLKVVTLSKNDGAGWAALSSPLVRESNREDGFQARQLALNPLKDFLLADQPIGTSFDLAFSVKVSQQGRIAIQIGKRRFMAFGYGEWAGRNLFARIRQEGEGKRIYFWLDRDQAEKDEPPLIPGGHLIAKKSQKGEWRIGYESAAPVTLQRNRSARVFQKYLLQDAREDLYYDNWPVNQRVNKGVSELVAYRTLAGKRIYVFLPFLPELCQSGVFAVTREIGGVIKFTEFYQSARHFSKRLPPLNGRILAVRPLGKLDWESACYALKWASLRRALKEGKLSREDLAKIFTDEYFLGNRYWEEELLAAVDRFKLYEIE